MVRATLVIRLVPNITMAAAMMMLIGVWSSSAQEDAKGNLSPKRLEDVTEELNRSLARKQSLEHTIEDLATQTENLSQELIQTASQIQARESQITAGEQRLSKLRVEEKTMRALLDKRKDALAELLTGLLRLEKDPPPALAVNPSDALNAVRSAILLGTVVPELRTQAKVLSQSLARMEDIRTAILQEHEQLNENLKGLSTQRAEIAALLKHRRTLTGTIRRELEAEDTKARDLATKARNLRELLRNIEEQRKIDEHNRLVKERQRLQAEQDERERQKTEARKKLAALMKPSIVFSKAKSKLYFPAQGIKVRDFGAADGAGGDAKGVSIATQAQAVVVAPNDGWIVYAGKFRGYGQLLIINAGEGYHVLLAGMKSVDVEVGQFMRAGEPIGRMGSAAAQSTVIGTNENGPKPILYIEFRKDGNPIDPSPWWVGSDDKVRG